MNPDDRSWIGDCVAVFFSRLADLEIVPPAVLLQRPEISGLEAPGRGVEKTIHVRANEQAISCEILPKAEIDCELGRVVPSRVHDPRLAAHLSVVEKGKR